jgi:hypothetical protein
LIAVLATIGGILVVGVGGGLIRPMQDRWARYLDTAEQESRNIRERVSGRREQVSGRRADDVSATGTVYPGASPDYPQPSNQPQHAMPPNAGYQRQDPYGENQPPAPPSPTQQQYPYGENQPPPSPTRP